MRKVEFQGYLYILIGSTLWGVSSVVAKSLFNVGLPPAELVLIRLILSTLTLLSFLLLFSSKRLLVSARDLPYFLILGLIGVAGMQYAYYFTISRIQVAPAILLQYLSLIWISIYSYLFQKEPFPKSKILSLLLALLGCYMVVGGYQINLLRLNKIGIISGLIGSLFFSFYILFGEKGLKKYDPWTIILYGFGFAAILFSIIISPAKIIKDGHSFKVWLAFIYISIFSTLIPFGLYLKGVECIRATRASITATWEPVVAGIMAYVFLGEVLSFLQVLGGTGVIVAIVVLQMVREKSAPPPPVEVRQSLYDCSKSSGEG